MTSSWSLSLWRHVSKRSNIIMSSEASSSSSSLFFVTAGAAAVAISATAAINMIDSNTSKTSSSSLSSTPLLSLSSSKTISWYANKFIFPKTTYCEESNQQEPQQEENLQEQAKKTVDGMNHDASNDLYYGYFPKRQLFQPIYEYPIWNSHWDNNEPISTGNDHDDKVRIRKIRKDGITRHIILIRHGQYDETYKEDNKRTLTPLGIEQAHVTGKHIAELINSIVTTENDSSNNNTILVESSTNPQSGDDNELPVSKDTTTIMKSNHNIKIIKMHVSQLTRAKETADIISKYLPKSVTYDPIGNSDLNEGRPCHTIPGQIPVPDKVVEIVDIQHPKIENAFRTYFYRHNPTMNESKLSNHNDDNKQPSTEIITTTDSILLSNGQNSTSSTNSNSLVTSENEKHEFEIIVCHANVIRYFLCRYV